MTLLLEDVVGVGVAMVNVVKEAEVVLKRGRVWK